MSICLLFSKFHFIHTVILDFNFDFQDLDITEPGSFYCCIGIILLVIFRHLNTVPLGKLKTTRFLLTSLSLYTVVPEEKVYMTIENYTVYFFYKLASLVGGPWVRPTFTHYLAR